MKVALTDATGNSVEVSTIFLLTPLCKVVDFTGAGRRCRFADNADAPLLYQTFPLFTTSKRSYVKMIQEALSERQRRYLLFVMLSLVVILFLQ